MTRKDYIDRLLKSYQVVHILADKNDCRVLHLRHRELGKDLVLHSQPTAIAAYEVLCKFRCDFLPLIYDVIALDDGQVVLEEFIDGITVADAMIGEHYDYPTAKKALIGVCDALTLLHEHRLVHRDVKPENVMVTPDGRVVLIDFNASRQITSAEKDTVIMGTFGYIAPEQLGVLQSDVRTDIYAVGVLLNVMLTGKHPSEEIVKGRAGHIVRKCTAVNPDERYQSAQKLVDAL
ncbi:MAG: serine/threonine protein kinase [Clostridia bacterium]|nr:serine/threonine protein kinase [Clostridia bacterium]